MHRHLAGIEIDTQDLGGLYEFFKCGHVVLLHQITEDFGASTEEVEA